VKIAAISNHVKSSGLKLTPNRCEVWLLSGLNLRKICLNIKLARGKIQAYCNPLPTLILTSTQNPLVKQVRRLHQAKERQQEQAFLIEGTHLLQEAFAIQHPLQLVCATEAWQQHHPALWQQAIDHTRTELVTEKVLAAMATTVTPDGVIAVADRTTTSQPSLTGKLVLALDRLQDPGNLGTAIRSAAAAGADGIWTSADSVDLDHPKVLRASAGQWFRLPMAKTGNLLELAQTYRSNGSQIIATGMTAAVDYWQIDFTQPTFILLGNEGQGLSQELMEVADRVVKIPMQPTVESLNVSITAALILYESRRQNSLL
jgi:RNA methyltransferase, TrmH family